MLTGEAVARAALRAGTAVSCSSSTGLQVSPLCSAPPCAGARSWRESHTQGLQCCRTSLLCCVVCPGAVVAAGEVHCSWTCCCASIPWVFSSLMHELCILDTHGCSESPHCTREQVSPLPSSGKPQLLPALFLSRARCGMRGWPGQQRRGLHAACGTTAPPS